MSQVIATFSKRALLTLVFLTLLEIFASGSPCRTTVALANHSDPPASHASEVANKLKGIVVDKTSGKAVAGATVAIADPENGYIRYMTDIESKQTSLRAWVKEGRESKASCRTVTGADGRFTLEGFALSSKKHVVGALDKKGGIALMFDVIPIDSLNAPLTIELEPPGFLIATDIPQPFRFETHGLRVSLSPQSSPGKDPEWEVPDRGVLFTMSGEFMRLDELKFGPLPPRNKYVVTYYSLADGLGKEALIDSRSFKVESGATTKISLRRSREGITVSGRITDNEGDPVEAANITLSTDSPERAILGDVSNSDGKYKIDGLPEGKYRLELRRYAPALDSGPAILTLAASQEIVLSRNNPSVTRDIGELQYRGVRPGDVAPHDVLDTLDGKQTSLGNLPGKFAMVFFWDSASQSCIEQLPALDKLYRDHKKSGFEILGISFDDDPKNVKAFVERNDMKWPQAIAKRGLRSVVAKTWGVTSVPMTFLIGVDGKVIGKNLNEGELTQLVAEEVKKSLND